VAELPWTDEHWNRICKVVSEEAQRSRIAARFLPIYGPISDDQVAVPNIGLGAEPAPLIPAGLPGLGRRLTVNSRPDTVLATLSMLVHVRTQEAADPELQAVIAMFRRATGLITRTEDALMFNGQRAANGSPPAAPAAAGPGAPVHVTGGRAQYGLLAPFARDPNFQGIRIQRTPTPPLAGGLSFLAQTGVTLVSDIVEAINRLEGDGFSGPYACVLPNDLYRAINTPAPSLTTPRNALLALLQDGMIQRSSTIRGGWALVVPHESGMVEQVLASDISVKLLHISEEPRFVFRISQRVALRVKEWRAVVNLCPPAPAPAPPP